MKTSIYFLIGYLLINRNKIFFLPIFNPDYIFTQLFVQIGRRQAGEKYLPKKQAEVKPCRMKQRRVRRTNPFSTARSKTVYKNTERQ